MRLMRAFRVDLSVLSALHFVPVRRSDSSSSRVTSWVFFPLCFFWFLSRTSFEIASWVAWFELWIQNWKSGDIKILTDKQSGSGRKSKIGTHLGWMKPPRRREKKSESQTAGQLKNQSRLKRFLLLVASILPCLAFRLEIFSHFASSDSSSEYPSRLLSELRDLNFNQKSGDIKILTDKQSGSDRKSKIGTHLG